MPLFEIETVAHIIISWAADEQAAAAVVEDAYPGERIVRLTRRPRDSWVISNSALGLTTSTQDPCNTARECLSRAAGDKVAGTYIETMNVMRMTAAVEEIMNAAMDVGTDMGTNMGGITDPRRLKLASRLVSDAR